MSNALQLKSLASLELTVYRKPCILNIPVLEQQQQQSTLQYLTLTDRFKIDNLFLLCQQLPFLKRLQLRARLGDDEPLSNNFTHIRSVFSLKCKVKLNLELVWLKAQFNLLTLLLTNMPNLYDLYVFGSTALDTVSLMQSYLSAHYWNDTLLAQLPRLRKLKVDLKAYGVSLPAEEEMLEREIVAPFRKGQEKYRKFLLRLYPRYLGEGWLSYLHLQSQQKTTTTGRDSWVDGDYVPDIYIGGME